MASSTATAEVSQLPLLSYGFRPFYLLASLYAGIAMILWILSMTGRLALPADYSPFALHGHEFLFGFAPAVLAGFLLTAAQSWSGQPTIKGFPLGALAALWLAGRFAMAADPLSVGAAIDALFLPLLALAAAVPIIRSRRWKHMRVVGLVGLLALANIVFHIEQRTESTAELPAALLCGLGIWTFLITLVGGRVGPTFLDNTCGAPLARRPVALETAVFVTTAAAFVMLAWNIEKASALVFGLAAALQTIRLLLWHPLRSLRDPLLWSLPLAYAWVPVGLGLFGLESMGVVESSAGIHAVTIGAVGGLMLAIMTRSSLGHTGRPLKGTFVDGVIYLSVFVAAVSRVIASLVSDMSTLITIAGFAWIVAFFTFALRYGPMLVSLRADEVSKVIAR